MISLDSRGRKNWVKMSDEEIVEHAKRFMKEKEITYRKELEKANLGLLLTLQRRKLLHKIGLKRKRKERRDWSSISDDELVLYAKSIIKEKGIIGLTELYNADHALYEALRKRALLDKFGFERRHRERRDWFPMSDDELIHYTQSFVKEKEITKKSELKKSDTGLFMVLRRRTLLSKIVFEGKHKDWQSMNEIQLVEYAQTILKEKGISGRYELQKATPGLYNILRKKLLLDKIVFEQKRREWSSRSDDELVQYAQSFMKETEITRRCELKKFDFGLFKALLRRNLLSYIFSVIKYTKNCSLERDLFSGLRQAPEAMEKFGEKE